MLNLTIFDEMTAAMINVDVANDQQTVAQVKQLIQQQTNIPVQRQQLSFEGQVLSDSATLASKNIKNHDVLLFVTIAVPSAFPSPYDYYGSTPTRPVNPLESMDLSTTPTNVIIQAFKSNAALMQQLMQTNPQFAQAIMDNNVQAVDHALAPLREKQRQNQLLARLEQNPYDTEAQKLLEEIIERQNIEENMATAMEYNPAAFASVYMLYVNSEVNGVPIKAFVDSGAQMTIMSKECATRCDLMRLCDKRYKGIAKGVGTANIIGRIHMAQLKVGKSFFPITITVLDQDGMEFLIGLDSLKQWQACIDLKLNCLIIGDEHAEFLAEKDLPSKDRQERDLEVSSDPLSPKPTSATTSGSVDPQKRQLDLLNQFLKQSQQGTTTTTTTSGPPPPQQQQQQSQPSSQQASSQINEQSVKQLMEMGFDRMSVQDALMEAGGNIEVATNILLRNKFGI
jgi:DNA damage-inducible protein 1